MHALLIAFAGSSSAAASRAGSFRGRFAELTYHQAVQQYLSRLLHDDKGGGKHHTLSRKDKERMREAKGERELAAEKAKEQEAEEL